MAGRIQIILFIPFIGNLLPCATQDNTGIFAAKVAQSSGSAFAITGDGTDDIRYTCIGN
jgi:hypothetical protein